MSFINIKAKKGLIIRDPISKQIISDKEFKRFPVNSYWVRRLKSGEVEEKNVIISKEKKEIQFKDKK